MRKLLKSIACFATAALVGTGALADYGWYDDSISIGSYNGAFSGWSGSPDSPTDLGAFSDLTVSSVAFNIWSDANDRGGANMYFRVYDANGQVGDDQDIWLGGATRIAGDHDFSISYSTPVDLAAATGLTMEEGKTYYVDIWAKSYGDSGDEWYSNGGANYHAKFTYHDPTKQSVTFDPDGGTCDPVSAVYTIGEPYGTLPTPTKDGYALIGWFDAYTGERVKAKYEVPDQATRTLVAQWGTPQTVTFNAGEGASCPVSTMVFAQEGKYEDLPKPTLADHTFAGWYDAQGNRVKDYYPVTDESSRTLTASWKGLKQTVHFDAGDGSCSTDSVQCYVGETYYGFPTPTWSGHTFVGWYDDDTGTRYKNYMSPVTDDSDLYLTAHWKCGRQTVNFNAGEGSCSPTSVQCYIGETYYGFPTPTWSGHTFVGWYDDDTGTRYKNYDSPVTSVSELNLTAHWKGARQTVHFDAGEGATCSPDSVKCYVGETYIGFPTPTLDGSTFRGWYDAEGTRYKNYMRPVTEDPDLYLTARWQESAAAAAASLASRAKAGARATTTVTDTLNRALTGVTGTSYASWSGKTNNSAAVYAGQSAGGNSSIQLRSNNNNSGIVTTGSGGKVTKVTIDWNSNTAAANSVDIYGKDSAYSSPTDLYNASTYGTKIGSLTNGTTVLTITNKPAFIGLRSHSGAVYLNSVSIDWEVDTPEPTEPTVMLEATATNVVVGTEVTITATATNFSGDVDWSWTVNGDPATGSASSFTLTPASAGDYAVQATATSGAQSTNATVTITATAPVVMYEIAIDDGIVNGSVETDPADEAAAGDPVTVIATADPGYKLDYITVNGDALAAGVTNFTMPAEDVTVSAAFVVKTGGTVIYTVTRTNAVSATGDVPDGSAAAYKQTYGTAKQATKDNSLTLTLSGYEGLKIVGLTLSMHSNAGGGAGTLSVTCGDATIASIANAGFGDDSWHGSYTNTYVDVTPTVTATAVDTNDVVIQIAATTNSLFCESYTIEYEFVPTVFSITLDPAEDFEVAYNAYATITATPHNAAAGDVSYAWTINEDPVAGATNNVLVLDTSVPDVYTAVCTAVDAGGATATASVSYLVNEPASPSVSLVASAESVRIGDAVTITATASDFSGEVEWVWAGDGEAVDSGNTSVFTVDTSTAGDHVVMVEATYGTESADAEITIAVEGPHDIEVFAGDHGSASAPDTAYAGETVTVTVTPDDGYTLDSIVVNDGDVAVTGTSFVMPDDDALVEVTFTEIPETVEFVRVTSVDDLTAGEYVITGVKNAGNNEEYAMKAEVSTTSTKYLLRRTSAVTIQTDAETGAVSVTDASDDIIWTLAKDDDDQWTIYNSATGYVYLASSANTANIEANQDENNKCLWTISSNSDGDGMFAVANVAYDTRQLRYNTTSGQERFACYAPGNSGTRTGSGLNFYKKKEAVPMQTVTFDPDGGSCDPLTARYVIGEPYGTLPTPTLSGYALIGWFDADTEERVKAKYEVPDQPTRSLVAYWGAPQVVTFDMGEGAGEATCPFYTMVAAYGGKYEDMPKPTWAGHTFAGWYDDAGNRVKDYYLVTDEPSRTLTASWKGLPQTVHFDAGDGECSPETVQCYIGGTYIGFPTPTWAGHTFVGWYDDDTGTRYKNYDSPVTAASDLYLTAHWKGAQQTVHFDAGDGTCSKESVKCYIGETYIGFPTPTWEGHTFVGWYDADGTRYKNYDSPVTGDSDLYLTAHWKGAQQTVHFDAGDGTCSKESVKCYIGETYIGFPTPTWDGHTFRGWYDADGTRYKNYQSPVTTNADLYLTATWKESASALSITAFEMSPRAVPSGTRSAAPATVESTLWFGTVAGTVYEVQWAPAVNGEWTVLKRWTAEEDGEMPVTVDVPAGPAGFFRLVEIAD